MNKKKEEAVCGSNSMEQAPTKLLQVSLLFLSVLGIRHVLQEFLEIFNELLVLEAFQQPLFFLHRNGKGPSQRSLTSGLRSSKRFAPRRPAFGTGYTGNFAITHIFCHHECGFGPTMAAGSRGFAFGPVTLGLGQCKPSQRFDLLRIIANMLHLS
jgi:hypothetical protein